MSRFSSVTFPQANRYIHLRDTLGTIYDDTLFADLFPQGGLPAQAPWQLALEPLMQFMENLIDRQVADRARSRIRCIVPECDGVFSGLEFQTNLGDKYSTVAPEQRRQFGPQSSVVRKAYK